MTLAGLTFIFLAIFRVWLRHCARSRQKSLWADTRASFRLSWSITPEGKGAKWAQDYCSPWPLGLFLEKQVNMENKMLWQQKGTLGTERKLPYYLTGIFPSHIFGLVDKNTEPYECLLLDVQLQTQETNFKAFFHSPMNETAACFPGCKKSVAQTSAPTWAPDHLLLGREDPQVWLMILW